MTSASRAHIWVRRSESEKWGHSALLLITAMQIDSAVHPEHFHVRPQYVREKYRYDTGDDTIATVKAFKYACGSGVIVMAKFACRCDLVIDLIESPAPEEFLLVPEINIDTLGLCENRKLNENILDDVINRDVSTQGLKLLDLIKEARLLPQIKSQNFTGRIEYYTGTKSMPAGISEIWIPANRANSMPSQPCYLLHHYIVEHRYRPPQEFLDALEAFDLDKPFDLDEATADLEVIDIPAARFGKLRDQH